MKFLTEITAIDPEDGVIKHWAGPSVDAENEKEARKILDMTGKGYCKVLGVKQDLPKLNNRR